MLDNVAEAAAHVAEVERFGPSARRDYVLGHLAVFSGAADQASGLLSTAWDTCDRTNDKVLAARLAIDLAHLAVNRGRGEETVIWARRALDATERHAVADATTALCLGLGALGRSDEALGVATIEAATPGDELGAKHLDALVGQGVSHLWTDQLALAQDDLVRAEIGLGQRGPLHLRLIALFYLATPSTGWASGPRPPPTARWPSRWPATPTWCGNSPWSTPWPLSLLPPRDSGRRRRTMSQGPRRPLCPAVPRTLRARAGRLRPDSAPPQRTKS